MKAVKSTTFKNLPKTEYDTVYGGVSSIQDLNLVIGHIEIYFTSDGKRNNFTKNSTFYRSSEGSLSDLDNVSYHRLLNAVFANPRILDSRDPKDEIIDTIEDVDKDVTNMNFKGTDVQKIFEDYKELRDVVQYFETSLASTSSGKNIPAFYAMYTSKVEPFYSCIKLYSDDAPTVLKKLERHYVRSIYELCSACNSNRDPADWCNPYTFIDEDKEKVKAFFKNDINKMLEFIHNPFSVTEDAMKRFKKLVELNEHNGEKLNPVISLSYTGRVTSYPVTMDNRFEVLSRFAFADQKSKHQFNKNPRVAIKQFMPLFDAVIKSSGGNKTHKLRIKNKNKTKSLRHKTRNTINRL
jgi:hypothetical protein